MTGHRLAELAARVGGRVVGDPERLIEDVRPLDRADERHLAVLHNPRYQEQARQSAAGAILVDDETLLPGRDVVICDNPYLAMARILEVLHPAPAPAPGVHPTASVDPAARLGDGVAIGPMAVVAAKASIGRGTVVGAGCVIGEGAEVGEECLLHPRVVVAHGCRVGDRCILQPGVVVGGDGYGYATADGIHHKVPQVGRAILEDDVELGANTTVDRGSLGDTVIGRGAKVDNLVMIAHNVQIGAGCLLTAQVGIAGSSRVGRYVAMGGQSGVVGHVELADGVQISAKAAVFKSLTEPGVYAGSPARPQRDFLRGQAALARLDGMRRRLAELERRLTELEGTGGDGG